MEYSAQQDTINSKMFHVYSPDSGDIIGTYEVKWPGAYSATSYCVNQVERCNMLVETKELAIAFIMGNYKKRRASALAHPPRQLQLQF